MKNAVGIGLGVVGIFLLFRGRGTTNATGAELDQAATEARNQGQVLTWPKLTYASKADALYEHMMWTSLTDDYGKVEDIIRTMQNDADIIELIRAYGTRQHYGPRIFPPPFPPLTDGNPRNLPQAIQHELDAIRIGRINLYNISKQIRHRW